MKKHYNRKDFVVTHSNNLGKYGYCKICRGDVQCFDDGVLRHYNSHQNYKQTKSGVIMTIN
jgi:hypothetical protein